MSKKFKLLAISLITAGILAVAITGAAFADDPAGVNGEGEAYCGQGGSGYHGHGAICSDTVGELLGLTHEEIEEQRHEGKSLVEIAGAQGVSEDALVEAILDAKRESVQQMVEDGTLTQEQANLMLQQMEQRTIQMVNRVTVGSPDSRGGCGYGEAGAGTGPGMMRHWGQQGGQGTCYGETGLGTGSGDMNRWGGGPR
jgi:hypothetical protein